MKKNIGIVVDNEFYGDIRVRHQAHILAESYNVYVLCFAYHKNKKVPTQNTLNENIVVHKIYIKRKIKNILFGLQNTFPFYDYFWAFHIKKFINKYELVSIHVHDLYLAFAGSLAKSNKPLILDLHENYPEAIMNYKWSQSFFKKLFARPQRWKKIEQQLLSYPDKIVVTNEQYKNALLEKYPILKKEKFFVFENVPDIKQFKNHQINKTIFDKKEKFIVFYFGVISERRGILTSIKAIESLFQQYPFLHLLLIGPIDNAERKMFSKVLRRDFVTHYPWKDISLLPSYLAISDICICPIVKNEQHDTCFANKIFQYALCEKAIISSDCIPHKEFIEQNECGLIFHSEDCDDLAKKIEFLLLNAEKSKLLGTNGKRAVESKYDTQYIKNKLFIIYADICYNK